MPPFSGKNFLRFNTNQPHPRNLTDALNNQAAGMLGIFWPFLRMPRLQRKRNSLIAFLGWLPKGGPGKKEKNPAPRTRHGPKPGQRLESRIGASILGANLLEAQHCQPQANLNYSMNIGKTHDSSATTTSVSSRTNTLGIRQIIVIVSLHDSSLATMQVCARVLQRCVAEENNSWQVVLCWGNFSAFDYPRNYRLHSSKLK